MAHPARRLPPALSFVLSVLGGLALTGCDGGASPTAPQTATVQFVYLSQLPDEPAKDADAGSCMHHMAGNRWSRTVEGVPVGVELRITVSDLLTCNLPPDRPRVVIDEVWANGVRLTRVVNPVTPSLTISGLAFTLRPDGVVLL